MKPVNPSPEDSIDPIRLMNLAARIALRAGEVASSGRRSGMGRLSTKSSPSDLVTQWDMASETIIRACLAEVRPGDGIVAEEGDDVVTATGITWYADPIDGTTNFAYGLPGYAVSIAVADSRGPLAAAVHAPEARETFVAARGHGAWSNGRRLHCSDQSDLSLALLATGFAYDKTLRGEQMRLVARHAERIRDIRRNGAAALDVCHVAAGRLDAFFERNLQPWDVAAGSLIAQEAGAIVTDLSGDPLPWPESGALTAPVAILVANSSVHADVLALFR